MWQKIPSKIPHQSYLCSITDINEIADLIALPKPKC